MKKYLLLALALFATGISLVPSAEAHDRDCYRMRRSAYVRGYQRGFQRDQGWQNGLDRRQMAYRNGYEDARWARPSWGNERNERNDHNPWW